MPSSVDFAHSSINDRDLEALLGPFEPGEREAVKRFDDGAIMAHLVHAAGFFSSVTQARKNGHDNPIPLGFSDHTVGKLRTRLWIVNVHPDGQPYLME